MNALNIPQHIIQSIGWTLIHSLWQGLAIFLLLKIAVKLLPSNRSDVRYGLGVGALVLTLICSVATFLVLNPTTTPQQAFHFLTASVSNEAEGISKQSSLLTQQSPLVTTILSWIDANIIWLIRFWVLGFVVGLVRIAAGLWYIGRLRSSSHPVTDEWMNMVNNLSQTLNIKRIVAIAEAGITSPMVIGFVKPMILFPFGLLAGLTPEQVETILVHELSHIRRQDYIINLCQAVVETIFFFNPFVMLISSLIREERENCCDDMVIAKGISPISYVKTLAHLEASRSSSTLALGIAGNKNQLLNRIKRIMENSAKNDWGKGRLVPVAVVFLGLICASWLSIGSEADMKVSNNYINEHSALAADTSKDKGLKVIKSNKHRVHEPVDEIDEIPEIEFVPDHEFSSEDMDIDFVMPPMMETPIVEGLEGLAALEALEVLESLPDVPMAPMDFNFNLERFKSFDSIPGFEYRSMSVEEMEEFEKEFTKKFKEQFKDFYEKNQKEINKLMEDVKKEHRDDQEGHDEAAATVDLDQRRRHSSDVSRQKVLAERVWKLQSLQAIPNPDVFVSPGVYAPNVDLWSADREAHVAEQRAKLAQMRALQFDNAYRLKDDQFKIMNDKMREQSDFFTEIARGAADYKEELTGMLRDDGYIGKNENIDQLNINDNGGELTINGKKIKEKDQLKYRALHDKHFEKKINREGYRKPE
jgi:beta-lactamase regulating signal transducer with metallopeptidase domain